MSFRNVSGTPPPAQGWTGQDSWRWPDCSQPYVLGYRPSVLGFLASFCAGCPALCGRTARCHSHGPQPQGAGNSSPTAMPRSVSPPPAQPTPILRDHPKTIKNSKVFITLELCAETGTCNSGLDLDLRIGAASHELLVAAIASCREDRRSVVMARAPAPRPRPPGLHQYKVSWMFHFFHS